MFYRIEKRGDNEKPFPWETDPLSHSTGQSPDSKLFTEPQSPINDPTRDSPRFHVNLLWASAPQETVAQADTMPGDVILRSQKDVDDFIIRYGDQETITIRGDFELNGEDIRDISKLKGTTIIIKGSFRVTNTNLRYCELHNLAEVQGTILITDNPFLLDVSFPQLEKSRLIAISRNPKLIKIFGSEKLSEVDGIVISGNDRLREILRFKGLKIIKGSLSIYDNPRLEKIKDFGSLEEIYHDFRLDHNPVLENVAAFRKLTHTSMCSHGGIFDLSGSLQLDQENTNKFKRKLGLPATVERVVFKTPENFVFQSQQDIDAFAQRHKNDDNIVIRGDLTIEGPAIENLSQLTKIAAVHGTLTIHNISLKNLRGLEQLALVEDFTIDGCRNLQTIEFPYLIQTGNLTVLWNDSLQMIAFPSLERSNYLVIARNKALTEISGFEKFLSCNKLDISYNSSLETISGFPSLVDVLHELAIGNNTNLKNISGFRSLTWMHGSVRIVENPTLTRITGFEKLTRTHPFHLAKNPQLAQADIDRLESQLGLLEEKKAKEEPRASVAITQPQKRTSSPLTPNSNPLEKKKELEEKTPDTVAFIPETKDITPPVSELKIHKPQLTFLEEKRVLGGTTPQDLEEIPALWFHSMARQTRLETILGKDDYRWLLNNSGKKEKYVSYVELAKLAEVDGYQIGWLYRRASNLSEDDKQDIRKLLKDIQENTYYATFRYTDEQGTSYQVNLYLDPLSRFGEVQFSSQQNHSFVQVSDSEKDDTWIVQLSSREFLSLAQQALEHITEWWQTQKDTQGISQDRFFVLQKGLLENCLPAEGPTL